MDHAPEIFMLKIKRENRGGSFSDVVWHDFAKKGGKRWYGVTEVF